ncbi:MAG: diaminopimelate epimerase [Cellulosilyticaceae bacterium]
MKRAFTKMHGCGNDYIYFNCLRDELEKPNALSIKLSDRHFSIGGDGIILICPSQVADGKMRIFNADGSEAKMCGNGIRCVAKYLYDHRIVDDQAFTIDTLSGLKHVKVHTRDGRVDEVCVDMGAPILEPRRIPVALEGERIVGYILEVGTECYAITCVSMGNPHCIVFVEDTASVALEVVGPQFEKHELFPDQVNTEFVQVINEHELAMRVWERGSGETFACGTGACAAVVAAVLNGYCKMNEEITVHLRGGDLVINYTGSTVYMTGEAVQTFEGIIDVEC